MKKRVFLLLFLAGFAMLASAQSYFCNFETQEERNGWYYIQGGTSRYWMIGTGIANKGSYSLYITRDGSSYDNTNTNCARTTIYALKKIKLKSGSHTINYTWKAYGNQGFYVYVISAPSTPPTKEADFNSSTYFYKSSSLWSGNGWTNASATFSTSNEVNAYILVSWYAYQGTNPPALDNIVVTNAYDGDFAGIITEGDYMFVPRGDTAYAILTYKGNAMDITLPTIANGKPVTSIQYGAFYNNSTLKSVVVPASYDSIASGAYMGCNLLSTIDVYGTAMATVKGTVFSNSPTIFVDDTTMYKSAWSSHASTIYLRSLSDREVTITARSSESALHRAIGDAYLRSIVRLKINGTINSYDIMIMRNKMVNLRFLDLTDATIIYSAYEYTTGYHSIDNTLTTNGINSIPLITLKLPKTLTTIQANSIPYSTITTLGINSDVYANAAFSANAKIAEVQIGGNATKVPNELFKGSTALRKAVIKHVSLIGTDAFRNCSALIEVLIDSVPTIGDNSFWNCKSLQKLTITEGTKAINSDAFNSCSALKKITLPQSLEKMYNRVFANTGLTSIVIPANLTSMGIYCFAPKPNNSGYKTTAPYTTYSGVSERYYYDNTYMTTVSGTYIYTNATLKSVTFAPGSHLKTIGRGAFMGCSGITKLNLPDSIEVIDQSAFAHCTGIDTLRLPNRLRSLGTSAFWNCSNLKHVEFNRALKTIPSMSFADCVKLDTLKMAVGLKTINPYAFYNCTGLKTIKISSSVENIGDYAFNNCTNVEKVYTYTLEPTKINQNTFSSWRTSNLFVPTTSFYTYFYETQWSQFLNLYEFDEPYEYFYLNNDYVLDDESGLVRGKPDADLYPGSSLIASASSTQELGILATNATSSGLSASILACQAALSADSLIIRIGTKKGKWSFFCFPMDIQFTQVNFPYRYVFREYNGQKRATDGVVNGYLNWQNVSSSDYLHHGQGYIFQGEETDSLVINIANPKFDCTDFGKTIQVYTAEHNYDMSWNYIGNPYPCYYDMDGLRDAGFITPVYVWNGNDYDVYLPGDDEYHFHPFEGFFVQNPNTTATTLLWQEDDRETKQQADEKMHNAPSRRVMNNASGRYLINITLSNESYSDRTRVVFNDKATTAYDLGKDAIKMTGDAPVHLYTLDSEVHYSINERPFSAAYMSLGYDVDSAGTYTLAAQRMDTALLIYDNELKVEVNLANGPYTFYTPAGVNETRFAIVGTTQNITTPTQLMILEGEYGDEVTVYDLMGNCLYQQVKLSNIQLPNGMYVLVGKEKTGKVLIQ